MLGSQPSASRPVRASMRGPMAPTQISTRCAGARAGVHPDDPVVLAVVAHRLRVRVPGRADDVDRLGERGQRLAGRAARAACGGDGVLEAAGAEPELHPPVAEQVEAGHGLGQDEGRAQRQVGDVGRDAHARGPGRDRGQQRPHVEEPGLVRMILHGDQVEPGDLGQHRQFDHALGLRRVGGEERAELKGVAVIGHEQSTPVGCAASAASEPRVCAMAPSPRSAAQLIVECLANEGVTHVFGIPGEENIRLVEALSDSPIEYVLARHEQGASFMAETYGRLTGRAGVCSATLGPRSDQPAARHRRRDDQLDAPGRDLGPGRHGPQLQGIAPGRGPGRDVRAGDQVVGADGHAGRGAGDDPQGLQARPDRTARRRLPRRARGRRGRRRARRPGNRCG